MPPAIHTCPLPCDRNAPAPEVSFFLFSFRFFTYFHVCKCNISLALCMHLLMPLRRHSQTLACTCCSPFWPSHSTARHAPLPSDSELLLLLFSCCFLFLMPPAVHPTTHPVSLPFSLCCFFFFQHHKQFMQTHFPATATLQHQM
jgi:hypothetical protein